MEAMLWVGRLDKKSLIYDSDIQLFECPHVFLWNPSTGAMEKYIATVARKLIKPHDQADVCAAYVVSYKAWKDAHADAWLREERPYYEGRRDREAAEANDKVLASLALEERHRLRLEGLGATYAGVRTSTGERRRRVALCYACRGALDNSIQVECVSCGWILCNCGACGCGR